MHFCMEEMCALPEEKMSNRQRRTLSSIKKCIYFIQSLNACTLSPKRIRVIPEIDFFRVFDAPFKQLYQQQKNIQFRLEANMQLPLIHHIY